VHSAIASCLPTIFEHKLQMINILSTYDLIILLKRTAKDANIEISGDE